MAQWPSHGPEVVVSSNASPKADSLTAHWAETHISLIHIPSQVFSVYIRDVSLVSGLAR